MNRLKIGEQIVTTAMDWDFHEDEPDAFWLPGEFEPLVEYFPAQPEDSYLDDVMGNVKFHCDTWTIADLAIIAADLAAIKAAWTEKQAVLTPQEPGK